MSLNDREGGDLRLNKERCTSKFSIAVKFLTRRVLNTKLVVRTFNAIWRSVNGFKVCNAGDHIILFTFDNEEEVEKKFEGEPWSFDKHLVIIQKDMTIVF